MRASSAEGKPRRNEGGVAGMSLVLAIAFSGCAAADRRAPTTQSAATAQSAPNPAAARLTLADQARLASVVEKVEPWTFADKPGRIITTANYRLFTTERDAITVDRAPRFLETALAHYREALMNGGAPLAAPPIRMDTFLMDNRAQWKRLVLESLGRDGAVYLNIPRGGFATGGRAYLYDIGVFDTLAIAAHEGWHQYTQRTFALPLPIWLEEGLAAYMEGHKWDGASARFTPWANVERFDQLRTASARGELKPLGELLESAPQDLLMHAGDAALTYYAQVWALIHFLAEGEGGRHRLALERLLRDFASGEGALVVGGLFGQHEVGTILNRRRGKSVFLAYFGADFDAAESAFAEFMLAVAKPGSRGAIVAGSSPIPLSVDR